MKLSLAASLLAQTLPTVALPWEEASAKGGDHLVQKVRNMLSKVSVPTSGLEKQECDIFSVDEQTGLLSCPDGNICKRNDLALSGGECSNNPRILDRLATRQQKALTGRMATLKNVMENIHWAKTENGIECDPQVAPDIGLLSCPSGQQCQPNRDSSLGGFCKEQKQKDSRNLFTVGICDPQSDYFGFYDCDCTNLDLETKTGNVTCLQAVDYPLGAVYNGCNDTFANVSFVYFFNYTELIAYDTCYIFGQPYLQKACTKVFPRGCEVSLNDEICNDCSRLIYSTSEAIEFDCSNVAGGRAGDTRETLLDFAPILDSCYIPPPVCDNLCTENQFIPEENYGLNVTASGIDYVTCEYLAIGESEKDLPLETCDSFVEAARSGCCEDLPPVECLLCADGIIKNPEGAVVIGANELLCTEAEVFASRDVNQVECDLLIALSSGVCCNDAPAEVTEGPSQAPSTATVQETDIDNIQTAADSGSSFISCLSALAVSAAVLLHSIY